MIDQERVNRLVMALHNLGVSRKTVLDLISIYPYDQIEAQLEYLPFRKARRPEAFIVDAIRHNYSAPKEFFYAAHKTARTKPQEQLDQNAESPAGQPFAETQGHGTEDSARSAETHGWVEPAGGDDRALLPHLNDADWPQE